MIYWRLKELNLTSWRLTLLKFFFFIERDKSEKRAQRGSSSDDEESDSGGRESISSQSSGPCPGPGPIPGISPGARRASIMSTTVGVRRQHYGSFYLRMGAVGE